MATNFWDLVEQEKKKKKYGTTTTKPTGAFGDLVEKYTKESTPFTTTKKKKKDEDDIAPVKTRQEKQTESRAKTRETSSNYGMTYAPGQSLLEQDNASNDIAPVKAVQKKQVEARAKSRENYSLNDLEKLKNEAENQGDKLKYTQMYNSKYIEEKSKVLANTQMDGTYWSVLQEMQYISKMDSSEEKDKRKEAVFKKMEELDIDTKDYALFAGDDNFTWGEFGQFLKNSANAGLASFNSGMASTANLILGKPLQAMGWKNNPITKAADYYKDSLNALTYNASMNRMRMGDDEGYGGWDFAQDAITGTVGALPNAIAAFITRGMSLSGNAATTAVPTASSLANNAAMQTGNVLTKAGLTTEAMMKNPHYWMSFAQTYGNDYEEAKERGASETAAVLGATITSLVNAGIEIGFDGASGVQGLPDDLLSGDKNKMWSWIESSLEEGGEEGLQKFVNEIVTKTMYDHEADILNPLEYAKEMGLGTVSGLALGGGQIVADSSINAYNQHQANKLTEDEKTVVDKIVDEYVAQQEEEGKKVTAAEKANYKKNTEAKLRRGYVTVEKIEEILGGDDYASYKAELDSLMETDDFKAYESALKEQESLPELEKQLEEMKSNPGTVGNIKAYDDLQSRIEAIKEKKDLRELAQKLSPQMGRLISMRNSMRGKVSDRVKGTRLAESYAELERRKEKYTADPSKYENEFARQTVQQVLDSGLGNGTNEFADKVEFMAGLAAKTGRVYKLMTEQELKDAGYWEEGSTTHGLVDDDGNVLLNYNSKRNLHWTVGHETGHAVEETGHYKAMQEALFKHAIAKEGLEKFNARLKEKEQVYKNKKNTTPEAELANDLLGEYVFTDYEFVRNLAKTDRTAFDKAFDTIKHLYKLAVAGSTQQRELEKAKHLFQKAIEEVGGEQKNTATKSGVKQSLTIKHSDGSVEVLSDARSLTPAQAVAYLYQAKASKLRRDAYIPLRKDTPQVIIDTLEQVNENIGNYSMVMKVKKAVDAMGNENNRRAKKYGNNVRKHGLTPEQIISIISKLDDPSHIVYETNRRDDKGNKLPNAAAVFVNYKIGDLDGLAVVEFENPRNTDAVGLEYGDINYHTVVTVFVPDDVRNDMPYDHLEDLLSDKNNYELEIIRRQPNESANGANQPNTSNELPSNDANIAQNEPVVKSQNSATGDAGETGANIGYHAGDLGKAEALSKQGLGRDTGHFGTGTYFVGNKAELNGYNKRNGNPAPVESVDFGKYNLFKPNSAEDGFALHDFLRGVDGYWDRDADAVNTMEEYESLQEKLSDLVYDIESEEFGVADPSTESWLIVEKEFLADAKRMMGDYKIGTELTSTLSDLTGENFQYDSKNKEYYSYNFETDKFTSYTEDEIIRMLNAEEGGWRAYEAIEKMADDYYSYSRTSRYETWSESIRNVANILGVSEQDVRNIVRSVTEEINSQGYTDADMETADSAATRFMKALGYEGIDVRGIKGLDNTSYGSVIYDLKDEDLTRKKEIGTAKFSMSKPVEETKDLVALHNLTAEKLLKSLELGGLPMPSIAITKADIPHDNFGDITLILGKDSVDPKANKKNVVYSADAWTPTFPQVEYESDSNVERQINRKLLDLATKVDDVFKHDIDMLRYGHEDNLNRYGGEEGYIQYVMGKYGMKAAYLEDQGHHIENVTKQVEVEKGYNSANEAKYQATADILGVTSADEIGRLNLKETIEQYGDQLEDIYPGVTKSAMRFGRFLGIVKAYIENKDSGTVYRTVTDESAMRKAVDDAIDMEGFEAWTRNLFSGIVKDIGIYNNKDIFTPSGNRRSFKQTHLPFTLENIVKAMASQNQGNTKNVSGFNGIKSLRAGTAERFKSIEAMHERKGRLQHLTQEEADKINDDLSTRLFAIIETIDNEDGNHGESNSFIRFDSIGEILMEVSEGGKYNVADIQKVFAQYRHNISDDLAADIKQLLFDVSQMPVNIYEAKPERAVSFDEVGVFVIPRNADVKLKQELLNRGYSIAEYDPDVEGDRNKVVNQFEEYKFSLSDASENSSTERGAFNERWSDFDRTDPLDIAPVAEENTATQDVAPVRQDVAQEAAPVAQTETPEEMFPDAPLDAELDSLIQRKEALEEQMLEMSRTGNFDDFQAVNTEWEAVSERINALEKEASEADADRMDSLVESEAPPDMVTEQDGQADVIPLTKKTLTDVARDVRNRLMLSNKDMYDVHKIIEDYSQSEFPSREQLFEELKEKFGTYTESQTDDTIKEAKSFIRKYRLNVADSVKKEIPDYVDTMRKNRGRILFANDGMDVNSFYVDELTPRWPHLFPESIDVQTDQFNRIVEVANMDATSETEYHLDDEAIWDVADSIIQGISDYKLAQKEKASNKYARESFNSLMKDADEYVPPLEDDIAPVVAPADDIAPVAENVTTEENVPTDEAQRVEKPINETLAAKIAGFQVELDNNRRLREESNVSFDQEIAILQAGYNAKKNKNTLGANDLLRRIERMKRLKQTVDADFGKKIGDLESRIEKMSTPEYQTAEQRRTKMQEHTDFWKNLLGDTSTWKDLALGLSYKTQTLRRILRKVVRDANGNPDIGKADMIYDALETKYDHNEALLKRESQKLKEVFQNLKLNQYEDTYAHMAGEFRHNPETTITVEQLQEYYNKHKNKIDVNKVNTAIKEARKTFDDLIVRVNEVLKAQGMKEIPYRKGYFPHFQNPKQNWFQKLINWKPVDNEIPTSIAGLTEMFEPQRSWQGFNKERKGDTTDYSLYQGLDTYIHGALDWIYHIDDLQSRRALENHIRYTHSKEGVKAKIEEIKANESYDADEAQAMIDAVLNEAKNPLNGLVQELMRRTNTLANKKASGDRKMESDFNRKVYSTMTNLNNRVNANMVVGSFSSALTNFIPMVQSWHQVSPWFTLRGLGDYVRSAVKDDGMIQKSDYLTNRLMEEENLYQTGWDKVADKAAFMMNVIDNITSQTVWRSKYLQNLKEGMSESQAIKDADQFAKNLMAGRSRGNMPTIFDEKNPVTKIFTAFQLEVANQYGYMFDDVAKDSKNPMRLVKGYATAFLGSYLYNALYSSLVGRDAAFDPMGIIEDLLRDLGVGDDDDEEDEDNVKDALLGLGENILQEVPFVGGLLGGGRIPVSSALPYNGDFKTMITDAADGEFQVKELLKPLYYLAMPVGGGQIKKTNEGLAMFSDDHPVTGSYTASGKLRYPVEKTAGNVVQAALFGQYANENARYYFDNDIAPLGEKQIQEYRDVDLPIRDYWDYREGLKGKDTLGEKLAYIDSLDLPIRKQNILANNLTDRTEPIDMADWDKYDGLEEYNYAKKYPEKHKFLESIGISYDEYESFDDDTKEAYSWAYQNPEKYTMSKAVTSDLVEYKQYTKALSAIKADKDQYGDTISGSAKTKKAEYINNLNLDYGQKIILYRSLYSSQDDRDAYNADIVEYLNSRNDLTYDEIVTILKELDFTVLDDGTVLWD